MNEKKGREKDDEDEDGEEELGDEEKWKRKKSNGKTNALSSTFLREEWENEQEKREYGRENWSKVKESKKITKENRIGECGSVEFYTNISPGLKYYVKENVNEMQEKKKKKIGEVSFAEGIMIRKVWK